jgi:four helix bundle protein
LIGDCVAGLSKSFLILAWHGACSNDVHDARRLEGSHEDVRGSNHQVRQVDSTRSDQRRDRLTTTDAATSAAAHYRAVCRARSRADFINKLSGAVEEVDEAALWLEMLTESEICTASATTPLWREADELTRILVRSRETARANQQSSNRK